MIHDVEPKTQTAIRTLIVAGYSIQCCHRQPRHIEIQCERTDILGASIPYLIALTDLDELSEAEISDIRHSAEIQNRILVIVARRPSETSISWEDFTEALGGAVLSWQALSKEYHMDEGENMKDYSMTPERIKQIRAKHKLTQEKMARLINVAHLTYVRWESGRNVPLPVFREKLEKLEQDKEYENGKRNKLVQ